MTTTDDLSAFNETQFADAISKFEELVAQNRRAFLLGAGCSKCAGLPLTEELTTKTLSAEPLSPTSRAILTAIQTLFDGATTANIEDYLSELIDMLAIAERRQSRGSTEGKIRIYDTPYSATELREATDEIKQSIGRVLDDEKVSIDTHQRFVKAVHRPLRPGKSMSGQIVDYLVLNYDTILEDALALERIPYSDGLDGGVTAWWNPATFERSGLAARVLKLHGSINWCELPHDPLPRRIAPRLKVEPPKDQRVLIWPASTKYQETQFDPYAQLVNRARQVLRPKDGSQCVLVICGYRFGDAHINLEVDRALRESAGDLTIIAFTSDNEPTGQLEKWYSDTSVNDQVLIFANRGFFHGTHVCLANKDLLWWKFENITRLLGGERCSA